MKTNGKLWSHRHTLAGVLALGLFGAASPALAQQDPDVADDPQATEEDVSLPDTLPEESEADENAQFGIDTANKARELRDSDVDDRTDFGDATAGEAREGAGSEGRDAQ